MHSHISKTLNRGSFIDLTWRYLFAQLNSCSHTGELTPFKVGSVHGLQLSWHHLPLWPAVKSHNYYLNTLKIVWRARMRFAVVTWTNSYKSLAAFLAQLFIWPTYLENGKNPHVCLVDWNVSLFHSYQL